MASNPAGSAVAVLSPLERARMSGDVRGLAPAERVKLLRQLVDEASLSWGASPPVILVSADGRLVPYVTKTGADQLAKAQGASVVELTLADTGTVVDATATARAFDGRTNTDVGSCEYDPDVPRSRARARMVAATRARRRTILGLLGSGFGWIEAGERQLGLDDVDVADVPDVEP